MMTACCLLATGQPPCGSCVHHEFQLKVRTIPQAPSVRIDGLFRCGVSAFAGSWQALTKPISWQLEFNMEHSAQAQSLYPPAAAAAAATAALLLLLLLLLKCPQVLAMIHHWRIEVHPSRQRSHGFVVALLSMIAAPRLLVLVLS